MKLFLSFRYTGETVESLQEFLYPLRDAFAARAHEVYLSLDDLETWGQNSLSMQEKFARTFHSLAESEALVVVVRSGDRSEGMLMEVGYAVAQKKPICLAVVAGTDTYIRVVATKVVEFTSQTDLLAKIDSLFN